MSKQFVEINDLHISRITAFPARYNVRPVKAHISQADRSLPCPLEAALELLATNRSLYESSDQSDLSTLGAHKIL